MPRTKGKSKAKRRRTKAEMAHLQDELVKLALEHAPATCRQIFYLAVARGLVEKTQSEYTNNICGILADVRLNGTLPWETIVDKTRSVHRVRTSHSLKDALEDTAKFYRRAAWNDYPFRVQIWTEKETLTGILWEETKIYDITIYPCRGFSSLTFLHEAAEVMLSWDRPHYIYYFGDSDLSGESIEHNVIKRLNEFTEGKIEINVKRLAVTQQQIKEMNLPTRPPKEGKSKRKTEDFEGLCTEVEAIEPKVLRKLCRDAIESHIDWKAWKALEVAEASERSFLRSLKVPNFLHD